MILTSLFSLGQSAVVTTTFTGTGSSVAIPASTILYHKVIFTNASTTFTACTVAIDSSPDGITWTAGGILASNANNCLNGAKIETIAPITARFVRVTVTTLTGTGLAVDMTYVGYKEPQEKDLCAGVPVQITMSTATTTQFIPATGGVSTHVCSLNIDSAGTTSVNIVAGTGSNCGTGTTIIAGPYSLTATGPAIILSNFPEAFRLPPGNQLCISNSAAVVIGGMVVFTKY